MFLPPAPFLLLLLVLLLLSLPHDVLDVFPLLVPLLHGHGSRLLLLELPLVRGDKLPQPRVEARTVGEGFQSAGALVLFVDRRRGAGRSGGGAVVIIIQPVIRRLVQVV